jgi:hypothetical protein
VLEMMFWEKDIVRRRRIRRSLAAKGYGRVDAISHQYHNHE